MSRPVRPAKVTLPERCDAAPVEAVPEELDEGEPDVEELFWVRLPPVPPVDVGETLLVAFSEAFLKADKVFSPDDLDCVNHEKPLRR